MFCPMCGHPRQPYDRFCGNCGTALSVQPVSNPAPKPRRGWVPVVLLAVMALLGILLLFLFPTDAPEASLSDPEAAGTSALSTEDCFTLKDGVLSFDRSKYTDYPVLLVPSAINGQAVTAIGEGCFAGADGITTIVLPSSVTVIEDRAFAGCPDLRGLYVPEAVTSIGTEAFSGCDSLESVYIPTALSAIGSDAFADCPYLTYLFYNGFYDEWIGLYPQTITPFTWAICWDGEYLHASQMA